MFDFWKELLIENRGSPHPFSSTFSLLVHLHLSSPLLRLDLARLQPEVRGRDRAGFFFRFSLLLLFFFLSADFFNF